MKEEEEEVEQEEVMEEEEVKDEEEVKEKEKRRRWTFWRRNVGGGERWEGRSKGGGGGRGVGGRGWEVLFSAAGLQSPQEEEEYSASVQNQAEGEKKVGQWKTMFHFDRSIDQ